MARTPRTLSILAKWRMNKCMRQEDLAKATSLSITTITRFESGVPISRLSAAKYLSYWGIDLNNSVTWPKELRIIDRGSALAISLEEDSTH